VTVECRSGLGGSIDRAYPSLLLCDEMVTIAGELLLATGQFSDLTTADNVDRLALVYHTFSQELSVTYTPRGKDPVRKEYRQPLYRRLLPWRDHPAELVEFVPPDGAFAPASALEMWLTRAVLEILRDLQREGHL
jgi:hypothetical protein